MTKKFVKKILSMNDYFAVGGVDEKTIETAEKELGLSFAFDFKEYLKELGQVIVDGHEFVGLHKSDRLNVVKVTKKAKQKYGDIPADWYVVEDICIDGILVWQSSKGIVYETNMNGESKEIAKSLVEYIEE